MNINVEKLKEMINSLKVEVSHYGFDPFLLQIVSANKLLDKIHEVADCEKDEFIKYINSGKYKENEYLKSIFSNIKSQGTFLIKGFEQIGTDSYIECRQLNWL